MKVDHPKTKRLPPISLRLTVQERKQLAALAAGTSTSNYIRKVLFGPGSSPRKTRSRTPVANEILLAQALGLLGKSEFSASLQHLAHHAEQGSLILDEETTLKISEACDHVASMRNALIKALGLMEEPKL